MSTLLQFLSIAVHEMYLLLLQSVLVHLALLGLLVHREYQVHEGQQDQQACEDQVMDLQVHLVLLDPQRHLVDLQDLQDLLDHVVQLVKEVHQGCQG